jgi:hypothetical protein
MRRPATILVASVFMLGMAGNAAAGGSFNSNVTIREDSGFRGRVTSPKPTCKPMRTIKVFRKTPGPDELITTDGTNTAGRWSTGPIVILLEQRYYAKVTPAEIAAGTCEPARSGTIFVD